MGPHAAAICSSGIKIEGSFRTKDLGKDTEVSRAAELQGHRHGWLGTVASACEIQFPQVLSLISSIAVGNVPWGWERGGGGNS